MEDLANGNTGAPTGVESADSRGSGSHLVRVQGRDYIFRAQEAVEAAIAKLSYGRRQECEEASELLIKAWQNLDKAKASLDGEGQSRR